MGVLEATFTDATSCKCRLVTVELLLQTHPTVKENFSFFILGEGVPLMVVPLKTEVTFDKHSLRAIIKGLLGCNC